ncbi:MAG: type IV pilus secretin PilQ [Gammaproteobacteria bacterium]|nr:MAG: type IV pilus secretin PilQ [Gammaproteobacteria bacterium]
MGRLGRVVGAVVALGAAVIAVSAQASDIKDIEFTSRPGSKFEIRLDFDGVPPEPKAYTIEKPARISLDFPGARSDLEQKRYTLPNGNTTDVVVLESGDRTRMVVNMVQLLPYQTRIEGNSLYVLVGQDGGEDYLKKTPDPIRVKSRVEPVRYAESTISDLQFQRSAEGEGRLILQLTDPSVDVNVFSEAGEVQVQFLDTSIAPDLMRRYDVTDFATPVTTVDVNTDQRGVILSLKAVGNYDYLAYQADNEYVLSLKPLTAKEVEERNSEFNYVGDRISLNFQDIEVRAVLQLIADLTDLNLVASDTVEGRITLRLQNVPWDQALELVLKTKGLDKRQIGNVLMVAPAAEIAERERQQIEANKQIAELAPLRTEFIRIRYAKADEVVKLFEAGSEDGGTLISPRGSVTVDPRTNSIIVTDTTSKLGEIRDLIEKVDIPVRQVVIEARIVIAQASLDENLGITWGASYINDDVDGNVLGIGGTQGSAKGLVGDLLAGGSVGIDGNTPMVNLGVTRNSGVGIGFASNSLFLSAELSALERSGQGEVVSQPKVITGDKQKANIKSGREIPYQTSGGVGQAATTSFKEAVLSLDVTPNITPDDRILLDLVINQDSVGELIPTGDGGGSIPSINTTQLTTQVLVGNGETVVLGGLFNSEEQNTVSKVPFFGDLPYVGSLFRSTEVTNKKIETLIFITPRILADTLLD